MLRMLIIFKNPGVCFFVERIVKSYLKNAVKLIQHSGVFTLNILQWTDKLSKNLTFAVTISFFKMNFNSL